MPTKREEKYVENTSSKINDILENFIESDIVDWKHKVPFLEGIKEMVEDKIRKMEYEDFMEGE